MVFEDMQMLVEYDISQELVTLNNIEIKSVLRKGEAVRMAVVRAIAEEFGMRMVIHFMEEKLKLRVSEEGRGREDIVRALGSIAQIKESEEEEIAGMSRM